MRRAREGDSDHRVLRALELLLGERATLRSAAVDEDHVVLRWWKNVAFEQIDDAVERVIEAWRTLMPYR